MQHGRFITTAIAAVAAMAIGPASAMGTPGSFTDDTVGDFNGGTPGTATSVIDPGVRLLKTAMNEQFEGTSLPGSLTATQWNGTTGAATVSGGNLVADGVRVHAHGTPTYSPDQVLEFRAAFTGGAFQHVGFGNILDDGPWAIFSTGGVGGADLFARTLATAGAMEDPVNVTSVRTALTNPLFDATQLHTYRIEWFASQVKYYVDGTPVATHNVTIAAQMRPVISDFTAGDAHTVTVDWLGLIGFPGSGAYESRVRDAGDSRVTWGVVTALVDKPNATNVTFETRTGPTPTPDASWSGYQPVVSGGNVPSPSARYIQYKATLTSSDIRVTPSLDKVQIDYDVDTSTTSGQATGTTASSGSVATVDKTAPKVSLVAKSLRASKSGTVSFRVGCPATEQSCTIKLQLKKAGKSAASKTVTVKGGKTVTVTLKLNKATRALLKHGSVKVSAVMTATDAAGNRKTTTRKLTLRRPA